MSVHLHEVATYQDLNRVRSELTAVLDQVKNIAGEVQLSQEFHDGLDRMGHLLTSQLFRVIVIGSFSRGKSTMVNALLGEKVLPAKLTPTTAVITVIKYGETPKAVVYYKDRNKQPLETEVEKLKEHLTIPRSTKIDAENTRIGSDIERVEIFYPLEICKNGVEIVDTPGLEEDEARQRITMQFLNQCDAAIVVLSCLQLITLPEERFIKEELFNRGYEKVFYVLNYGDQVQPDEEDDIWERFEAKLGTRERSFMISSKQALDAKAQGDQVSLQRSNFRDFESSLEQFLVQDSGKLKVRSSQKMMSRFVDELRDMINISLGLLENNQLEDLERIEVEFREKKENILERKEYVLRRIGEKGAYIGERLHNSFTRRINAICRELPVVAQDIEVEGSAFQQKEFQNRVGIYLENWVRQEINDWIEHESREILQAEGEKLQQLINSQIENIVQEVEELRFLLHPSFDTHVETTGNGFERLLAAGGSLLLGDIGGAITGGAFGVKGAVMQFGGLAIANTALWALGLLNPFTALLASAGVAYFLFQALTPGALKEAAVKMGHALVPAVQELPDTMERQIKQSVFQELNKLAVAVNDGVLSLIYDLEGQVISAKEEIRTNKYGAIAKYTELARELQQVETRLNAIAIL